MENDEATPALEPARQVEAIEDAASAQVTLAIRPERVVISKAHTGQFCGTVAEVVYEGIDTTYHLCLPDGSRMRVCVQNRDSSRQRFSNGESVSIALPPDAIKVLTE